MGPRGVCPSIAARDADWQMLVSRLRWLAVAGVLSAASPAALATAAHPTSPLPGSVFRGKTAQQMAVRLGPLQGQVRTFRYQARLRCSDGSTFTDDPFTDLVRLRRGHFSLSRWTDARAVHVALRGVVRGRTARGTIRITERYSEVPDAHGDTPLNADGGILCDSRTGAWRAKLNGS